MFFLIHLENFSLGKICVGHLEADTAKKAQRKVFNFISRIVPKERIGMQVTDYSTVTVGPSTIYISPIKNISENTNILATLIT
ncbi:hypothetical protein COB87_000965 [Candidatus Wolfebacteria bacterium]|nr:hypothetical protein [Candidatus Wolfebacteria bacterium]